MTSVVKALATSTLPALRQFGKACAKSYRASAALNCVLIQRAEADSASDCIDDWSRETDLDRNRSDFSATTTRDTKYWELELPGKDKQLGATTSQRSMRLKRHCQLETGSVMCAWLAGRVRTDLSQRNYVAFDYKISRLNFGNYFLPRVQM
jgi:hypothetical protein